MQKKILYIIYKVNNVKDMRYFMARLVLKTLFCITMLLGILSSQIVFGEDRANQYQDIYKYIENQMEQYNIPSLSLGIVKNGTTVFLKGFGNANSSVQRVTPQTPFIIGSVSKSFTALAVMQLAELGRINLDDGVDKYLPWFVAEYQGKSQVITVRQLLHHTSGIKPFYDGMVDSNVTIEQLVRGELNSTELNTVPGTCSDYSNANYIILGEIIQRVSGQSYEDYITEKIFKPLEMKHSYLSKTSAVKDGLATGHQKWFGFPVESDVPYFKYSLPEGQIISCAEDMLHYISALLNKGVYNNIRILSEEGVKELFNTEVQEEYVPSGIKGTASYYGFGWRIIYDNDKISMIQHTGETANYHANVVLKLDEGIGVVELDSLGGDMSPVSIGVGVADIMSGGQPKVSRFINNVFIVEIVIVFLVGSLILFSVFRLRSWKLRIGKSKGRLIYNIIFATAINLVLPLWILLCMPGMFGSVWSSSMLIFPDIAWTALIIAISLILIGAVKLVLTILYTMDNRNQVHPQDDKLISKHS